MREYAGSPVVPAMRAAGFDPASVDVVAMSHLHFDHAGGLLLADGSRAFPKARIVAQRGEWEVALGGNSRLVASYDQPELRLSPTGAPKAGRTGIASCCRACRSSGPAGIPPATRRSSCGGPVRARGRWPSSATSACARGPRTRAGKSSNAVTQRGFAAHGRMHRSPKKASDRAPGPVPRTTIAWWPAEWPAGADDGHARQELAIALRPALGAPVGDEPQLGLVVRGDEPAVAAERDLPLRRAGPRCGPSGTRETRPRAAGRRHGRSGDGSSRRCRRCRDRSPPPRIAGTTGEPAYSRIARAFSSSRSPIPVSTSTRPAGVSTSRQLSAWSRRRLRRARPPPTARHRIHGTGPKIAPESVRNVPACTSATRVPPPRSALQSPASRNRRGLALRRGRRLAARGRSRRGRPMRSAPTGPGTSTRARWLPYGRSTGELIRKKLICPIRMPA